MCGSPVKPKACTCDDCARMAMHKERMTTITVLWATCHLFIHIQLIPLASTEATYHIKPASTSPCQEKSCLTLQEYAANIARYFDPDTVLRFYPGLHTLNNTILRFENFDSLSFLDVNASESSSTFGVANMCEIRCNGTSAIVLYHISNLTIRGLTVKSCGSVDSSLSFPGGIHRLQTVGNIFPALSVLFVLSFQLTNCSLVHNHLGLFTYLASGHVKDSNFKHNIGTYGGGLLAQNSSVVLEGHNWFLGNSAEKYGGGVYAINSHLKLIDGVTFTANKAHNYGGGIYSHSSNIVLFSITASNSSMYRWSRISSVVCKSVVFTENMAKWGGGLFLKAGSLISGCGILNFTGNLANRHGGGIAALNTFISIQGLTIFVKNLHIGRAGRGGAVSIWESIWMSKTIVASSNSAFIGGVIQSYNSKIYLHSEAVFPNCLRGTFNGCPCGNKCQSIFENNSAFVGSVMYFLEDTVELRGNIIFQHNRAVSACLHILDAKLYIYDFVSFTNNTAKALGGGGVSAWGTELHFGSQTAFTGNFAGTNGGGIFALSSFVKFSGNTSFLQNKALLHGGGMYLDNSTFNTTGRGTYIKNTAGLSGGMIKANSNSTVIISDNFSFEMNMATFGGAISLTQTTLLLAGTTIFASNCASRGGALSADEGSHILMGGIGTVHNNVAKPSKYGGYGGGIYCLACKITLSGTQNFSNNSATYGGGMAIEQNNYDYFVYLATNSTVYFVSNRALKGGGAIAVEELPFYYCASKSDTIKISKVCFLQVLNIKHQTTVQAIRSRTVVSVNKFRALLLERNISAHFIHNMAESGDNVFGGALETCYIYCSKISKYVLIPFKTISGSDAFGALTNSSLQDTQRNHKAFASTSFKVCFCESSKPNCSQRAIHYNAYPGQRAFFTVASVGQMEGLSPALIRASFVDSNKAWLGELQELQSATANCVRLEYTLFSEGPQTVNLSLYTDGQDCALQDNILSIVVTFLHCPPGFALIDKGKCECERRLQQHISSCIVDNQTITHGGGVWIGFDGASQGVILHPHCLLDYCKPGAVSSTLNSTDQQCAHRRSGIICGACKSGLSLNLGSSRCSSCSNWYLLLFLPFAIAGFLLVIFLFVFKVTVAAGTTSGLLFYANMIALNHSIFYASREANPLTAFIAWLNLDLGIETCLFDGLDAYTRAWLQFVFPLYIWALVGLITLASRYSILISKVIGPTNPISVLATLFLLSYTKLLRTIIATFSFTTLEYPDDRMVTVWAYDGNIKYLHGNHIPLFLAGLLAFIFFFLPYTLLLLVGQWIERGSNHRLLSWVSNPKIKSFLDAYHAPYKSHHRYWTGLLLILRLILFIISAVVDIRSPRDPSVNLLALGIGCIIVTVWALNFGAVYKESYNTVLESSFMVNLAVLALWCYQVKVDGGNQAAVVYTSMSIAAATFLIIIAYHMSQQTRDSRHFRNSVKPKLLRLWQSLRPRQQDDDDVSETPMNNNTTVVPLVTTTFIDLRESLLTSQD